VNAQDSFGWSPIHYACLTSQAIFLKLIQSKANFQAKTHLGATCNDLKRFTTLDEEGSNCKQHIQIEDELGNIVPLADLSPEHLKELTGLDHYKDHLYFPQDKWKKLWKATYIESTDSEILALKRHAEIQDLEKPPRLTIAKCRDLMKAGILFYELQAGEEIFPGKVIGLYSGEIFKYHGMYQNNIKNCFTPETDAYALGDISARKIGNAMRFMNCGFPNVVTTEILINGFPQGVCIATSHISQGESLQWDYGYFHTIGRTFYIPLSQDKVINFYSQGRNALFQSLKNINSNPNFDCFKFFDLTSKLDFLRNNPTILLFLHLKNILPIRESRQYLINDQLVEKGFFILGVNYSITDLIMDFEKSITQYTTKEKQMIKNSVLEQIGSVPFCQILKYLSLFNQRPSISEESLTELKNSLSTYDFNEDSEFPLSDDYFARSAVDLAKLIFKKFDYPMDEIKTLFETAPEHAIASSDLKNKLISNIDNSSRNNNRK
jgi:hypothetical protein